MLQNISDACGYTDFSAKYATYPPNGSIPLPLPAYNKTALTHDTDPNLECQIFNIITGVAPTVNPAFNPYRITDGWPILWVSFVSRIIWSYSCSPDSSQDPLGLPGSFANIQVGSFKYQTL